MLMRNYESFASVFDDRRKNVVAEIEKCNLKLGKARDLLFAEKLDADDYKEIKDECKIRIEDLELELSAYLSERKNHSIKQNLNSALSSISSISALYREGDIETKRYIVRSIYPEKLVFDGSTYRTPRVNVIAEYIFRKHLRR
ncbi:hypothetical protein [Flavobacterium hibisci]|uniref:hypothetical protein n=1 Tax=Flavobacterium hibisci TaxID=1914462 RepID=UPI001CC0973D|nr:hypothetical protein [Flavobacterium hibisci]MBZ4043154.1 hypothetical protein [Flavobacterium hibisci]